MIRPLDAGLADHSRETATRHGFRQSDIPSGAGLDACHAAARMPAVTLFIPCHGGISHHPGKAISPQWAARGLRVLADAVIATASSKDSN